MYFYFPYEYKTQESTIYRRNLLSSFGECNSKPSPKRGTEWRLLSSVADPCGAHRLLQNPETTPRPQGGVPCSHLLEANSPAGCRTKVIRKKAKPNYYLQINGRLKDQMEECFHQLNRSGFLLSICIPLTSCSHD